MTYIRNKKTDRKPDPDLKVYAVFPDYWPRQYGERPLLGFVKAYDEFYAIRKAYDRGLLPINVSFGPKVVEQRDREPRPAQENR